MPLMLASSLLPVLQTGMDSINHFNVRLCSTVVHMQFVFCGFACTHTHIRSIYAPSVHAHPHAHPHTHTDIHTHTHAHPHTHTHTHTRTHTHTPTHTHTHTRTHTHTHTRTPTHVFIVSQWEQLINKTKCLPSATMGNVWISMGL